MYVELHSFSRTILPKKNFSHATNAADIKLSVKRKLAKLVAIYLFSYLFVQRKNSDSNEKIPTGIVGNKERC